MQLYWKILKIEKNHFFCEGKPRASVQLEYSECLNPKLNPKKTFISPIRKFSMIPLHGNFKDKKKSFSLGLEEITLIAQNYIP